MTTAAEKSRWFIRTARQPARRIPRFTSVTERRVDLVGELHQRRPVAIVHAPVAPEDARRLLARGFARQAVGLLRGEHHHLRLAALLQVVHQVEGLADIDPGGEQAVMLEYEAFVLAVLGDDAGALVHVARHPLEVVIADALVVAHGALVERSWCPWMSLDVHGCRKKLR